MVVPEIRGLVCRIYPILNIKDYTKLLSNPTSKHFGLVQSDYPSSRLQSQIKLNECDLSNYK